jgi:hypothetical protein
LWALGAAALTFAASTLYLATRTPAATVARSGPTVRLFWSQVFPAGRATDIVLDDAALALYQELSGTTVTLSNYFDRTYLRSLPNHDAESIVLRRQTSVSSANLLWKLMPFTGAGKQSPTLRFARDYTFRDLRANNAVLLGNSRSNPWIEPFETKLGLRWTFDRSAGTYYPVDSWTGDRKYQAAETREGYCSIALVPNLGQTGNVLIVGATGGSAFNAGIDFLADEDAMRMLRSKLPGSGPGVFPAFEALIKVRGRGGLPKDATIEICRSPK